MISIRRARRMPALSFQWENGCWFSLACSLIGTLKASQLRREIHAVTGSPHVPPSSYNSIFHLLLSGTLRTRVSASCASLGGPLGIPEHSPASLFFPSASSSIQWEWSLALPSSQSLAKRRLRNQTEVQIRKILLVSGLPQKGQLG